MGVAAVQLSGAAQEVRDRLALGRLHVGHHAREVVEVGARHPQRLVAGVRGRDEGDPAAVLGVAGALHVPRPLEPIGQSRGRRGGEPEPLVKVWAATPSELVGAVTSGCAGRLTGVVAVHTTGVPSRKWTVPATAQSASEARRSAIAFAAGHGVGGASLAAVRLALAEAIANAVVHAFADRDPGTVGVEVSVDPDAGELRAVVRDDGQGIAPRLDSPGMGVGMPLIAAVSAAVEIRVPVSGQGTEVAMTFDVAPGGDEDRGTELPHLDGPPEP